MTMQDQPQSTPAAKSGIGRRIAVALALGALVFVVLWWMALSFVTSVLVGSGTTVILAAGASFSDVIEAVLDWLAGVLAMILAAIAAVFAAIMSLFDL
jgi:hypothetical protein